MHEMKYVLAVNRPLPDPEISSWPALFEWHLERSKLFDFVLTPSSHYSNSLYCKKRKISTRLLKTSFRYFFQKNFVFKDYYYALRKNFTTNDYITIVVIDDASLADFFCELKTEFINLKVIFNLRGHVLHMHESTLQLLDKVIFLTHLGYHESKQSRWMFTPKVDVVPSGIDSNIFFPIANEEKLTLRSEKKWPNDQPLIVWMANDRPIKGLHIFLSLAQHFALEKPDLRFMVIGNKSPIDLPNVINIGRLPHEEVPKLLQLTDIYLLPTLCKDGFPLSLLEAIKCGNIAIAAANGGVPEVLEGCERSIMVLNPNIVGEWIEKIEYILDHLEDFQNRPFNNRQFFDIHTWEKSFIKAVVSH